MISGLFLRRKWYSITFSGEDNFRSLSPEKMISGHFLRRTWFPVTFSGEDDLQSLSPEKMISGHSLWRMWYYDIPSFPPEKPISGHILWRKGYFISLPPDEHLRSGPMLVHPWSPEESPASANAGRTCTPPGTQTSILYNIIHSSGLYPASEKTSPSLSLSRPAGP
jgi:hypothetical protein